MMISENADCNIDEIVERTSFWIKYFNQYEKCCNTKDHRQDNDERIECIAVGKNIPEFR
jgi:hypothetical protein